MTKFILAVITLCIISTPLSAQFTYRLLGDSIERGGIGDELPIYARIYNATSQPIIIDAIRLINNLPDTIWKSAICLDVCFSDKTDSARIQVEADSSLLLSFHFFSSPIFGGCADARLLLRNVAMPSNQVTQNFYGATKAACFTVSTDPVKKFNQSPAKLSPQPVQKSQQLNIYIPENNALAKSNFQVQFFDLLGNKVATHLVKSGNNNLSIKELPAGVYFYKLTQNGQFAQSGKFVVVE